MASRIEATMPDIYLLIDLVVVVALGVLGVTVLLQDPKVVLNKLFALFAASIGIWILANYISNDISYSPEISLRASYLVFAFSYASGILFLRLVIELTKDEGARRLFTKLLGPIFAIGIVSGSPLVVSGVALQGNVYSVEFGPAVLLYGVGVLSAIFIGTYLLHRNGKAAEGEQKKYMRVLYLSALFAFPALAVIQFIIPLATGWFGLTDIGILPMLIVVFGFYYGATRHGLFDIKLAAVRSVAYAMSLLALAAIYYAAAYLISTTIFQEGVTANFSVSPLNIFLALVLAFIFQPIRRFFDRATDKIFYRDRYDSEAFFGRLSEILTAESTDLRKFLARIAEEIGTTLRAEVAFLQVQWGHHHASAGDKDRDTLSDSDIETLRLYVLEEQCEIIVADTLAEDDPIRQLLVRHGVAIAVPLVQKSTIFGYLFLGNRRSGGYTARDKKVLETISNELVVAVQNALSLQEIKDFNVHLQQRIEAATSELVASNEQLKRLDAAKDEFVSMASHQLRTPLTSVKGYISMVLEGDAGKITPMQKRLLGEAFVSSERMVHLIGDFLNVSRLQTGRFVLDQSLINLADLVEEEVDGLKATAKARSLRLQYRKPANIPSLYIDGGKIHQVIMNFIDNAIYYSMEDTAITVKVGLEGGYVVFTVKDTGIGVPEEEQAQLFTKFFRATNARRQRPDGTGIGLYLARKVIDAHSGTMVFESKEGKGSTFGFRLPIKKLSENPAEAPSEE